MAVCMCVCVCVCVCVKVGWEQSKSESYLHGRWPLTQKVKYMALRRQKGGNQIAVLCVALEHCEAEI